VEDRIGANNGFGRKSRKGKAMKRTVTASLVLALSVVMTAGVMPVLAADVPTVEIVAFAPPSVGSFLAPVIEQEQTDIKNGVDIKWILKPAKAYNTGYFSGEHKVGSSAALLSEALRYDKGMKTVFLFGTFDYFGAILANNPSIKTLKDLEGKKLAGVKVTTNYAMFVYFAKKEGVDLDKVDIQSVGIPALGTNLLANRVDAIQLWEPAFTKLTVENPGKFNPVFYHQDWEKYTGRPGAPYLGVAAHEDWVKANPTLIGKIYKAFKDAETWLWANPVEGAKLIAEKNKLPLAAITDLLEEKNRLGLHVIPAEEMEEDIFQVFKAGTETGYLKKLPGKDIIYRGLK